MRSDICFFSSLKFLYIDPLKQGLKPDTAIRIPEVTRFLYIDPLKQGLKHNHPMEKEIDWKGFYT